MRREIEEKKQNLAENDIPGRGKTKVTVEHLNNCTTFEDAFGDVTFC